MGMNFLPINMLPITDISLFYCVGKGLFLCIAEAAMDGRKRWCKGGSGAFSLWVSALVVNGLF